MASIDQLAVALFGSRRAETQEVSTDATTRTYVGVAVADSDEGTVEVSLDGDVTLPDDIYDESGEPIAEWDGTGIEMPTGPGVSEGDEVIVTLVGGGPLKTPMVTAVSGEGDRQDAAIDDAARAAEVAWEWADEAHTAATTAQERADDAARSAADAADSASDAATSAGAAQQSASSAASAATSAQTDASAAAQAATAAQGSASTAATAATSAEASAGSAATSASSAAANASTAAAQAGAAQRSAAAANTAANSALAQLSVVEDVSGTLSWIRDHGAYVATSDTSVQEGRVYFELVDGDYVPIAEPAGNPRAQGWYVLDVTDSQTDYIMSHLAVTSAGLWVLPSGLGSGTTPEGGESQADSDARQGVGYKMLLASGGTYVYDGSGELVRSDTAAGTDFSPTRPFHIGSEDAYIVFAPATPGSPATITIGGSHVVIGGSKTLTELLADVEQAADMCTISLTSTNGTVFKQNAGVSTSIVATLFTGDGLRIESAQALRARYGSGAFLQWRWKDSGAEDFTTLLVDDPRLSAGGFMLTVSPSDISTQAVIDCELVY